MLISFGFLASIRVFEHRVSSQSRRERGGRFFFCFNWETAIEAETPLL
jgi:hypothetical protein